MLKRTKGNPYTTPTGPRPNRYESARERQRARIWNGRYAKAKTRVDSVPWKSLPLLIEQRYQQRLDLNWYSFPIENLVWVMTRNYHPRWRVHYQTVDAMLGMEFVFWDEEQQQESAAAWYWYQLRPRQLHFRLGLLRWLVQSGYWSDGAYWLLLPDRTGYFLNASALVRWNAVPFPTEADRYLVSLWLRPSMRVVSFSCSSTELNEIREAFVPIAPNEVRLVDLSKQDDWYVLSKKYRYIQQRVRSRSLRAGSSKRAPAPDAVPHETTED